MRISVITTLLLLSLTGVAYAQVAVVGVVGFNTVAQNISCEGWESAYGVDCNQSLSEGFKLMLETAIVRSGKMNVMERGRMETVFGEQLLGQAGLTDVGGQVGGVSGVDYLIYGSITKFGASTSGLNVSSSGGVGSLLGGRARRAFGGGVQTANVTTEMAVDIRITDVETGQIILADSVEGTAETGRAFAIAGIGSSESSADPFADVQRIMAARLAETIVMTRFPMRVISVQDDGTLIINYGDAFLSPGQQLVAVEIGASFTDPDTGQVLGTEETEIGRVEIIETQAQYSRARPVGDSQVPTGSVVKRPTEAASENTRSRSGGVF